MAQRVRRLELSGVVRGWTALLDLSGTVDYQVRVRFRDQHELYEATNALRVLPGVVGIGRGPSRADDGAGPGTRGVGWLG